MNVFKTSSRLGRTIVLEMDKWRALGHDLTGKMENPCRLTANSGRIGQVKENNTHVFK